jgi:hypothetical protein
VVVPLLYPFFVECQRTFPRAQDSEEGENDGLSRIRLLHLPCEFALSVAPAKKRRGGLGEDLAALFRSGSRSPSTSRLFGRFSGGGSWAEIISRPPISGRSQPTPERLRRRLRPATFPRSAAAYARLCPGFPGMNRLRKRPHICENLCHLWTNKIGRRDRATDFPARPSARTKISSRQGAKHAKKSDPDSPVSLGDLCVLARHIMLSVIDTYADLPRLSGSSFQLLRVSSTEVVCWRPQAPRYGRDRPIDIPPSTASSSLRGHNASHAGRTPPRPLRLGRQCP